MAALGTLADFPAVECPSHALCLWAVSRKRIFEVNRAKLLGRIRGEAPARLRRQIPGQINETGQRTIRGKMHRAFKRFVSAPRALENRNSAFHYTERHSQPEILSASLNTQGDIKERPQSEISLQVAAADD